MENDFYTRRIPAKYPILTPGHTRIEIQTQTIGTKKLCITI